MSSHLMAMDYISKERMAERRQAAEAYRLARSASNEKARGRSRQTWMGRVRLATKAFITSRLDKPALSHGSLQEPVEISE